MWILIAGISAYFLDLLWGHPAWLAGPVWLMKRYAAWYGTAVRPRFPSSRRGEFWAGTLLALSLPALALAVGQAVCVLAGRWHPAALFAVQTFLGWQAVSVRELAGKGRSVWQKLWEDDLPGARIVLKRVSGRNTAQMSRSSVIRATVETVAEGFPGDAVLPLLAFFVGGAPLVLCCQAVCTLDGGMERKTPRETVYGRAAGALAAIVRFLPARIAALFWILAARLTGHNALRALRVWLRGRRHMDAPAEVQTASACAGALGIRLGGGVWVRGRQYETPALGDDRRPVQRVDLLRTIRMLYMASFLMLVSSASIRLLALWINLLLL